MKSCTITSDGTVKYLNATDRTKYEDGTDRDMTLNTMVEIPEFWYKCMRDDTTVYLNLYPADPHIPEAEHVEKFYISAYEASNVDNVLKSINNGSITPVVNINRTTMQSRAGLITPVLRIGTCILTELIEYLLCFTQLNMHVPTVRKLSMPN